MNIEDLFGLASMLLLRRAGLLSSTHLAFSVPRTRFIMQELSSRKLSTQMENKSSLLLSHQLSVFR